MAAQPQTEKRSQTERRSGFDRREKSAIRYADDALRAIEGARSTFASEAELEAERAQVAKARRERRTPSLPRLEPIAVKG